MPTRRRADHVHAAVTVAFLILLVALGLLGISAPLVVAIGLTVAALGIFFFRSSLEGHAASPAQRPHGPR